MIVAGVLLGLLLIVISGAQHRQTLSHIVFQLRPQLPPTPTPTLTPTPTPTPTPVPTLPKAIVRDVYAVVHYVTAPAPAEISREEIKQRWFKPNQPPLYVTADAYDGLVAILFEPPAEHANVHIVPSPEALVAALRDHPDGWGIVPFHELLPPLVPIPLEGIDLLDPRLSPKQLDDYYLSRSRIEKNTRPHSNRDPEHLAVFWVTGNSTFQGKWARVAQDEKEMWRAFAPLYSLFSGKTWVHIHLDVPLNPGCKGMEGDPCAPTEVVSLLRKQGVDSVSLASPWMAMAGRGAALYTLKQVREAGMVGFGVGRLHSEEIKYTWEARGARIAWVNVSVQENPGAQWATEKEPGPLPLDPEHPDEWIWAIRTLRQTHDAVVLLIRWYQVEDVPPPELERIFDLFHAAGATAVIGVQPGFPQPIVYDAGGIRAYGLGDFFHGHPSKSLTLQLYFYDGRLIAVRPYLLIPEGTQWHVARGREREPLQKLLRGE